MRKPPRGQVLVEDSPYESDPLFLSTYTLSKMDAERAVLEFAEDGEMEIFVLRPGILYGPRGKWNISRLGCPAGKKAYVTIGFGGNQLPVCYVRNCAHAALTAAETGDAPPGTYNIIDDEIFTQLEYLKRLKKDVRPGLKIIRVPYLVARAVAWLGGIAAGLLHRPCPIRPAHLIACRRRLAYSNDKAKHVLGWRPLVGKEEALTETMRCFAEREHISRRADLRALGKPPRDKPVLTACVVGCGMISSPHLETLSNMKNARLLAICDSNRDAANETAQRFKILHVYDDVETMLDVERPDVLHVLTPPRSHAEIVRLAAERGCNLLVETPMATDTAEAVKMMNLAEKHGVQICVDHNHLYDPIMVRARRLVESGALGDIIWVESYYGFDLGNDPSSRYLLPGTEKHWTFQLPGKLYQNLAPHPLSVALDVLGMPTTIEAHAQPSRVLPHQPTDELRVRLETKTAAGLVTVSIAAGPGVQYMNIVGTRMRLSLDFLNKWMICECRTRGIPRPTSRALMNLRHGCIVLRSALSGVVKVLLKKWTRYDGMDLLIREYYAALQERRPSPVTAQEALRVMKVMDAIWEQLDAQWPDTGK